MAEASTSGSESNNNISDEPLTIIDPAAEVVGATPAEAAPEKPAPRGWGAGTELKKIFKRFGFEPEDDL